MLGLKGEGLAVEIFGLGPCGGSVLGGDGVVAFFEEEIAEGEIGFWGIGNIGVGDLEIAFGEREIAGVEGADAGVEEVEGPEARIGSGEEDERGGASGEEQVKADTSPAGAVEIIPKVPEAKGAEDDETGDSGEAVAFGDKDGEKGGEMEEDGGGDPAGAGEESDGGERSCEAEGGDPAEVEAWGENVVVAEAFDGADIVVLEGVPEVGEFGGEELEPSAGVFRDISLGFGGPEAGDLGAGEFFAEIAFGDGEGIFEHAFLGGAEAWGHFGVAVGGGVIADPEVDSAMGGEEHGLISDAVIVNPHGGGAEVDAPDEEGEGEGDFGEAFSDGSRFFDGKTDGEEEERDGEKDGGDEGGDDADEDAQGQPRVPKG